MNVSGQKLPDPLYRCDVSLLRAHKKIPQLQSYTTATREQWKEGLDTKGKTRVLVILAVDVGMLPVFLN